MFGRISVGKEIILLFVFAFMFMQLVGAPAAVATTVSIHSSAFKKLVWDSYEWGNAGDPNRFFPWLDTRFREVGSKWNGLRGDSLDLVLSRERRKLSNIRGLESKALEEQRFAGLLHKLVKLMIPRFSLDRGFEFYNVARYGERQCLLQSVLTAGLLEEAGVRSGIAMVYKNDRGKLSNNGHVVTIVKLADGRDIIVDASESNPFARHRGLMVAFKGSYCYMEPQYADKTPVIIAYKQSGSGSTWKPNQVNVLDYDFIRSQFFFYRGERAPGGLLAAHPTSSGLLLSERAMALSVKICPQNPLSVYTLGKIYAMHGYKHRAAELFSRAYGLYAKYGWIPDGPKEYYHYAQQNRWISSKL